MPNAYKLLVGLTAIDAESDYYRTTLPGFDGRSGCEGCQRDVELLLGLTHYLGYAGATARPLLNEKATRANVLNALTLLADSSVLRPGDIVFLFFSCHGRRHGPGPVNQTGALVGSSINSLLLWNGPLFNFEILERIVRFPSGVRVFTLLDACHSGIGSNLAVDNFLREASRVAQERFDQYLQSRAPGAAPGPAAALTTPVGLTSIVQKIWDDPKRDSPPPQLCHFGAARDSLTALGGSQGSLFTRTFYDTLTGGGDSLSYPDFFREIQTRLPARHSPVMEVLPYRDTESTGPGPIPIPKGHFASTQPVLRI